MRLEYCFFLLAILVAGNEASQTRVKRHWYYQQNVRCSMKCFPHCRRVVDQEGCFEKCDCPAPCPTPACERGCTVQPRVHGPCPGCVCGPKKPSLPPPPPPPTTKTRPKGRFPNGGKRRPANCDEQCPPHCRRLTDPRGCFEKCDCTPDCPTPSCEMGCTVEENVHGPCPGCVCDDKKPPPSPPTEHDDDDKDKVPCDPPKCKPGCRLETKFGGPCPECVCDDLDIDIPAEKVICDPPRCGEPGCRIDTSGPCPKCVCEDDAKIIDPRCAPLKCDPGCRTEKAPKDQCPHCECPEKDDDAKIFNPRVQCAPLKCDPGCRTEKAPEDECPHCECPKKDDDFKDEKKVVCSPKCPQGCRVETDFDGPCPGCDCSPKNKDTKPLLQCTPPKCEEGCKPEREPGLPCPICKCKDHVGEDGWIILDEGENVACAPPKCPPGCNVLKVFDRPCPGCECDEKKGVDVPFNDCELQACPPDCPLEEVPGMPCPQCVCKKEIQQCPPAPPCRPPQCQLEEDANSGCPVCKCLKPKCSPPKCRRFCKIQPGRSGCLECVCPGEWRHQW